MRTFDDKAFNERLGHTISIYWAKLGFKVSFIVETEGPQETEHFGSVCGVRTDMINGLPVRTLGGGNEPGLRASAAGRAAGFFAAWQGAEGRGR